MTTSSNKLGLALGIAGVALFGGTLPATRLAVVAIDPLFLTAARATIAGIAGLSVLVLLRRPAPPMSLWHEIFLSGLCTIIGFPVLMALAMVSVLLVTIVTARVSLGLSSGFFESGASAGSSLLLPPRDSSSVISSPMEPATAGTCHSNSTESPAVDP